MSGCGFKTFARSARVNVFWGGFSCKLQLGVLKELSLMYYVLTVKKITAKRVE